MSQQVDRAALVEELASLGVAAPEEATLPELKKLLKEAKAPIKPPTPAEKPSESKSDEAPAESAVILSKGKFQLLRKKGNKFCVSDLGGRQLSPDLESEVEARSLLAGLTR